MIAATVLEVDASNGAVSVALSGTGRAALNCLYWGFVPATALLGITIIQGFLYFKHCDDKRPLRLLVSILITLDILTSCLSAQVIYHYMIQNYGNTVSFAEQPPPTFAIEYVVTSTVTFLCQMFYASQIVKLRRHSYRCMAPYVIMILLSLSGFISHIVFTALVICVNYFAVTTVSLRVLQIVVCIGNSCATASDLMACAALCLFLASHRADLGRSHTTLVDILLLYTINRGVFFSILQIGRMSAYIIAPITLYWVPFHFCLSKLHVNSLLALLNSRKALRGATQDVSKIDFRVDPTPAAASRPARPNTPVLLRPVELRDREESLMTDNKKFNRSQRESDRDSYHSTSESTSKGVVLVNDRDRQ